MRLSMGMDCVGIYDTVMGDHTSVFMESSYVRHCPFVTYACTEEGCGLLADGQTRQQLINWRYAVTVCVFQMRPVAGSLH